MSLLDIAKGIKAEGFDPRKDKANGPAEIPAGTYPVVLKSAQFNISDKGWESLGYQFEIRGGDYIGRSEYANFGTLTTWNGKDLTWSVERTVKFFQIAVALAGDDTFTRDFEDGKSMEEALQRKAVGSYYQLVIIDRKGKNGQNYRSYELELDDFKPVETSDINDDDLPF